ncbi:MULTISPECIES: hypothetical protein [unclassified Microcoleus]
MPPTTVEKFKFYTPVQAPVIHPAASKFQIEKWKISNRLTFFGEE